MFYNLDNLYDTIDDPTAQDKEFTPIGSKRWDSYKYKRKLENIAEVFLSIKGSVGDFPVLIGVSEIENDKVLEDLVSQKRLAGAHYKYIHYDSKDARGVDVALLFRPAFKLIKSEPVKLVLRSGREYIGRDFLFVLGEIDGELFAIYVCHLLSRRAGVNASQGFRKAGAETIYNHAAELKKEHPEIKVIVMGDMNDSPADESLRHLLKARRSIKEVGFNDYFNPMWHLMDKGYGTSIHKHRWVLYDNIIVNHNLLTGNGLKIMPLSKGFYAEIFVKSFMMAKGQPKRSFVGNKYIGGYSDHLPVFIRLKKDGK